MAAEHGYTRDLHDDPKADRGCVCSEDFDHDGKCQNALRSGKYAKCAPCSQGWHFPYPCNHYQTKGRTNLSTQCQTCGWDVVAHPDRMAELQGTQRP